MTSCGRAQAQEAGSIHQNLHGLLPEYLIEDLLFHGPQGRRQRHERLGRGRRRRRRRDDAGEARLEAAEAAQVARGGAATRSRNTFHDKES